ncbi:hypothetical protein [Deinococcus soli (ex Cha et al. 2016)]|uniref:hypothetical protein n=1 Tax=Deinococcus soli (ex Cha et al. 2016) TaxID=1309411 RepID=UPI00166AADFA|nr:hypothetical protein [Deinococcus soli (ex Cha et al. 2016)]GGB85122.1 hypothetical protein GCM10008019_46330 [Deinococcus soli (ex Cha et al. 2016)]
MHKHILAAALALSCTAHALTIRLPESLEVGRRIPLTTILDSRSATVTSNAPDVIEVSGGALIVKRLTPTGTVVTLTAKEGVTQAQANVRTHGVEVMPGLGTLLPGTSAPGLHPFVVVRARTTSGKGPEKMTITLKKGDQVIGKPLQVTPFQLGGMSAFASTLPVTGPVTIEVRAADVGLAAAFSTGGIVPATASLVQGVRGSVQGRALQLTGTLPAATTVSARLIRQGAVVHEQWLNVAAFPATVPLTQAPAGAADLDLRVYSSDLAPG